MKMRDVPSLTMGDSRTTSETYPSPYACSSLRLRLISLPRPGELEPAQLDQAHLPRGEALLELQERLPVVALLEILPDAVAVGIDGAVRDAQLVGGEGVLGAEQADAVDPELGAEVDEQLVAVAQRVVQAQRVEGGVETVGRDGEDDVLEQVGGAVAQALRQPDGVVAEADDLELGDARTLVPVVADRALLLGRQLLPGLLLDQDLAGGDGLAEMLDGPPVMGRQQGVPISADFLAARTVGVERLEADDLRHFAGDAGRERALQRHLELELPLLLVAAGHLGDAVELGVVAARGVGGGAPVRQQHAELQERVSGSFLRELHPHPVGDHRAPEIHLEEPVVQRVRVLRFPVGQRVAVHDQGRGLAAGADLAHPPDDGIPTGDHLEVCGVQHGVDAAPQESRPHFPLLDQVPAHGPLPVPPVAVPAHGQAVPGDGVAALGIRRAGAEKDHGEQDCMAGIRWRGSWPEVRPCAAAAVPVPPSSPHAPVRMLPRGG